MAPDGVDLELCTGSSSSLPRPVRIRSVLKKEAVCGGRAGGWQLSLDVLEDKSTEKTKRERSRLQTEGTVGGREDFRNTKKKRWKGDSGELGTGS